MSAETFLIGYGTLLHRGSLGDSIGAGAAHGKDVLPVVIRDHRRLFNLRPTHYTSSFMMGEAPIENAAMNVEPARGSEVNALAFPTSEEELERLDHRERYYARCPIEFFDFETEEVLGIGHVYRAAPDAPWLERDPSKLLPRWEDIVLARSAAYQISRRFGESFDATTYLADGETLMIDAYRGLLDAVSSST